MGEIFRLSPSLTYAEQNSLWDEYTTIAEMLVKLSASEVLSLSQSLSSNYKRLKLTPDQRESMLKEVVARGIQSNERTTIFGGHDDRDIMDDDDHGGAMSPGTSAVPNRSVSAPPSKKKKRIQGAVEDGNEAPTSDGDADPSRKRIMFPDDPVSQVADYYIQPGKIIKSTALRRLQQNEKSNGESGSSRNKNLSRIISSSSLSTSSLSNREPTRHMQLGSVDLPASSASASKSILRKSSSYDTGVGVAGTGPPTAGTGVASVPPVASAAARPVTDTSSSSSSGRATVRDSAKSVAATSSSSSSSSAVSAAKVSGKPPKCRWTLNDLKYEAERATENSGLEFDPRTIDGHEACDASALAKLLPNERLEQTRKVKVWQHDLYSDAAKETVMGKSYSFRYFAQHPINGVFYQVSTEVTVTVEYDPPLAKLTSFNLEGQYFAEMLIVIMNYLLHILEYPVTVLRYEYFKEKCNFGNTRKEELSQKALNKLAIEGKKYIKMLTEKEIFKFSSLFGYSCVLVLK